MWYDDLFMNSDLDYKGSIIYVKNTLKSLCSIMIQILK